MGDAGIAPESCKVGENPSSKWKTWHGPFVIVLRMTDDSGQKNEQEKDKPDPADHPQLPPGTEAIVQCEKFSCLARINEKGEWQSLRGKLLKVVRVVKVL